MSKKKVEEYRGGRKYKIVADMMQPRISEVLEIVKEHGPISHGEIVGKGVPLSTVSHSLRVLRGYAFVKFHASIADNGERKYIATKNGEKALHYANEITKLKPKEKKHV